MHTFVETDYNMVWDATWINLAAVKQAHSGVENEQLVTLYDLEGKKLLDCERFEWKDALQNARPLVPDRTGANVWVVGISGEEDKFGYEVYPVLAWRANGLLLEPVTFCRIDALIYQRYILEMPDSFGEWRWFDMDSEQYYTNRQTAFRDAETALRGLKREARARSTSSAAVE